MSEFTECYQLLAGDVAEGAALLERAGLSGWAFPAQNGWVTVVVERPYTTEPDPPLIDANQGVLALFVNAEDHGWSLSFWEGAALRSHYRCEWDDEITADTSGLSPPELRRLLAPAVADPTARPAGRGGPRGPARRRRPRSRSSPATVRPSRAARLLGFPNADWISGDYLARGDDRAAHATRITR